MVRSGIAHALGSGAIALAVTLTGCSSESETGPATRAVAEKNEPAPAGEPAPNAQAEKEPSAAPTQAELIKRGRGIYVGNCIACHSTNPAKDGALGPAVAGSSHALLEDRVINGTYPEGYEPKRKSTLMIPLPHLEPDIDALTAYLDSVK